MCVHSTFAVFLRFFRLFFRVCVLHAPTSPALRSSNFQFSLTTITRSNIKSRVREIDNTRRKSAQGKKLDLAGEAGGGGEGLDGHFQPRIFLTRSALLPRGAFFLFG